MTPSVHRRFRGRDIVGDGALNGTHEVFFNIVGLSLCFFWQLPGAQ